MKLKPTSRGFMRGEFKDQYKHTCSIQESSLATSACIWLGLNDSHAAMRLPGVAGWVDVDLEVLREKLGAIELNLWTRMHLNQRQVKALLPLLQHFVEHGTLPPPPPGGTKENP